MKSIHYMALITTIVALSVYGVIIYRMKAPADRRWLWLTFAIALPLQPGPDADGRTAPPDQCL